MLHRPGPELARLTPRNNDSLLFDGIPWVQRAQEEHDIFAGALRDRGVEVLYLADLVTAFIAGIAHDELKTGTGLVYALMDRHDFVIDPLPNLLFTRDSAVWI